MGRSSLDIALVTILGLCACAGPPAPVVLDPVAEARWAVAGFRDTSPLIVERLDRAAAWAVFADTENPQDPCTHEGLLFEVGREPRAVFLHCQSGPSAPAGGSDHLLVILDDPSDVRLLHEGALELGDAPLLAVHDEEGLVDLVAKRLLLTTSTRGLLFDPSRPARMLSLRRVPAGSDSE